MPLTSVLLPVYNGELYLESALRSVLAQAADLEVLVQDDCSRDNTARVAQALGDSRVKYVRNPKNLGCWASLQAAADRAQGELLRLFSHDDLMLPGDISRGEQCLRSNPDYGIVISDYEKIDPQGDRIGSSLDHRDLHEELPDRIRGSQAAWCLFRHGCVSGTQSTITVRRQLFQDLGGFDTWMLYVGDFAFLAKAAIPGGLVYNRQVTTQIRFHPQQTSKKGRGQLAYFDEMHTVHSRLYAQMSSGDRHRAKRLFKWIYGYQLFDRGLKAIGAGRFDVLRRLGRHYGWPCLFGSGYAWSVGLPGRLVRRFGPSLTVTSVHSP